MNIENEKILLRAIEFRDNDMLLAIINDTDTEYMLGGWSFPISSLQQEEWLKNYKQTQNTLRCIIQDKKLNKALGMVTLTDIDSKNGNAEIHIKLAIGDEFRNKGYGSEAINLMVNYAFNELRLNLVYAKVNEYNISSQKMFLKCGFTNEGILKHRIFKKGKYYDVISFSIINPN